MIRCSKNGVLAMCMAMCMAMGMVMTGCSVHHTMRDSAPRAPAGVVEALPTDVAGPPQDLQIPHQGLPPVIMAVAYGGKVRMHSGSTWHGRVVDIYYTPASNIAHQGNHLQLIRANRVQHLVRTNVGPDGTWRAVWNYGNYGIPKHTPFFMIAKDDKGEVGLLQVNAIN